MPDDIIEYRTEYVVERHVSGNGPAETFRFHTVDEAVQAVTVALGAHIVAGEEFGGRIVWYVDETTPLAYFDEIVTQYDDHLHGGNTLHEMSVDRNVRYLLVEANVRGGYWLTSGDDPKVLVDRHLNQEYAEDWELVAVHDLVEQRELEVTLTAEVS